jgi:hypothetical protein
MTTERLRMPAKPANELIVSEEPVSDDTVIWRYFKFDRFVDVLETHSLWFSRPFKFDDRWEGLFPPSYIRRTRQYADAAGIPFEEFDRDFRTRRLRHQYGHFVNCWHMSDHESDAMWRLYARARRGIAIRSTVGDVKECLRAHNSGKVIYYDPSHDVRSAGMVGPHDILFKRNAFSCEQEYRFWFDDDELSNEIEAGKKLRKKDLSPGRRVDTGDMGRLIQKIVVAPGASEQFIEDLRGACVEYRKRWLWTRIERSYSDRMWDSFNR